MQLSEKKRIFAVTIINLKIGGRNENYYLPYRAKTSSIREVYKSITGNYPDEEGDFNGTYQHPEFGNIGFSSWGDPGANEEPLDEILQMNCDFVISACRSKGQTIEVVKKLANKYNYQVYYVYLMHGERADTKFHNIYIKSNAEAVMEIIKLI